MPFLFGSGAPPEEDVTDKPAAACPSCKIELYTTLQTPVLFEQIFAAAPRVRGEETSTTKLGPGAVTELHVTTFPPSGPHLRRAVGAIDI